MAQTKDETTERLDTLQEVAEQLLGYGSEWPLEIGSRILNRVKQLRVEHALYSDGRTKESKQAQRADKATVAAAAKRLREQGVLQ